MNTVPECDLNWIQECDGFGMIAKCRQAEIRQDKSAVSLQRSSRSSRIPHFTWQRVLAFASAITVTIAIVVMQRLG